MKILSVLCLLLCACTMKAEYTAKGVIQCKDLRDGETFAYDTKTVRNGQVGFGGAPSTFEYTDTAGRDRLASSEDSSYIKCEPAR